MKIINKVTLFILSISQVVLASKLEAHALMRGKMTTESNKNLATELHEKKLIKSEKSSESANCVGNLTD